MCFSLAMSFTTLCFSTQGIIVGYEPIQHKVACTFAFECNLVYLHASVTWMCFVAFLIYMVGMNGLRKCPG